MLCSTAGINLVLTSLVQSTRRPEKIESINTGWSIKHK